MNLEKAIQIAVTAHSGAKDKGGKPYILHPINVMMRVEKEDEKIVAILDYEEFVKRSLDNDIGRIVKIADLKENLDISRIGDLNEKDILRINKYKKALKVLNHQK